MVNFELTLLDQAQLWGQNREEVMDLIRRIGPRSKVTDLALLTGSAISDAPYGSYFTSTPDLDGDVSIANAEGGRQRFFRAGRSAGVRPVLQPGPALYRTLLKRASRLPDGTEEILLGSYPQFAAPLAEQEKLDAQLGAGELEATGRCYSFDFTKDPSAGFTGTAFPEYSADSGSCVCLRPALSPTDKRAAAAHFGPLWRGDHLWLKVSPVSWLLDRPTRSLVSRYVLLAGIRFCRLQARYFGDFSMTDLQAFFNDVFSRELLQGERISRVTRGVLEAQEDLPAPEELDLSPVTEEDIIRGAVESGVAVFLHGPSSEGKSARIKQLDPDCEVIYLRNATPESLNGKSVYNQATGEMIELPPAWLKKVQTKCAEEPDRFHIVFFDEITNALPSIQGIAFNIVLEREVNGKWKLPDNARIVAAGNDMKDSLAANQLAEPLFNRFAHVYIHTSVESWLLWAREHGIHPAIYAFIAFRREAALRSRFDGERPNADPRKWELASRMLYTTGQPEMLRSLVGEEICREFVEFCRQPVISLPRVLSGDYSEEDLPTNAAAKYASAVALLSAKEEDLEKVRTYLHWIGEEYVTVFDSLWSRDSEHRLETIAELRLAERDA